MVTVSEFQQLAEKFNLIHAYEGNPLVNAMCVGLIDHEDIQKGQAHGVGNTVCMLVQKQDVTVSMVQHLLPKN